MTEIDICNRALAAIGHDRTITVLNENSAEAVRCSTFYPVARDKVLGDFAWEWATKTCTLTADNQTEIPSEAVRIIDARDDSGNPVTLTRQNNTITADKPCTLRYVANDIEPNIWPTHVVDAVVSQLASLLLAPMLGNPTSEQSKAYEQFFELARQDLTRAKEIDIAEHAFMGAPKDPTAVARTDIANRALAIIGSTRLIRDITEDPCEEAVRCRQLLPMAMRKVFSAHPWEFATRTKEINDKTFDVPNDFLRLVSVYDNDNISVNATITQDKIYLERIPATIKYVSDTISIDKIPPAVSDAIVYALSAALATSMQDAEGKSPNSAATIIQQFDAQLAAAKEINDTETAWRGSPSGKNITETDVCNRALAIIGATRMIKDLATDTDPTAARCRQIYNTVLEEVLASHNWDFAAVELNPGVVHPDNTGYARIVLPEDCLRLVNVVDEQGRPLETRRTRDFLLVKALAHQMVKLRYISHDIKLNETPVKFREVVIYKMAELLAPLMDDKSAGRLSAMLTEKSRIKLSESLTAEADETAYCGEWENPFINARR